MVSMRMESRFEAIEKQFSSNLRRSSKRERCSSKRQSWACGITLNITLQEWRRRSLKMSASDLGHRFNRVDPRGSNSSVGGENEYSSVTRRRFGADQWRKIDLPLFHGEDDYGWLDRMERCFQIRGVPVEEWLSAAKVAVEGQALTQFHWWEATAVEYA